MKKEYRLGMARSQNAKKSDISGVTLEQMNRAGLDLLAGLNREQRRLYKKRYGGNSNSNARKGHCGNMKGC